MEFETKDIVVELRRRGYPLHKIEEFLDRQENQERNKKMNDPTETIHRQEQTKINAVKGSREALEAEYGQVWDTDEMQKEFTALGFMTPYITVQQKSDRVKGSLQFQHDPRFYFNFQPDG